MITDYFYQGRLDELVPTLTTEELSESDRASLGRIHPSFMGGEYLPDYLAGEVEIVRVELRSTTADVISLRARQVGPKDRSIEYRLVDEYETEFRFRPRQSGGHSRLANSSISLRKTNSTSQIPIPSEFARYDLN
jgi:hypothetical protein